MDPKNQYFAKLMELNKNHCEGFKEIMKRLDEYKRRQFNKSAEIPVMMAESSQDNFHHTESMPADDENLDKICDELMATDEIPQKPTEKTPGNVTRKTELVN